MNNPHSIIFCDIDGCLNDGKHIGLDLKGLGRIRAQIQALSQMGIMFCLCTGRPQPYAEAMAQVLDLQTPFICEHGAMVFDPIPERIYPMLSQTQQQEIDELRQYLQAIVGVENTHTFEPGNEFGLCITGPGIIERTYNEISAIKDEYQEKCARFDVNWVSSNCAIDISPKGISKQSGAAWILERYDVAQSNSFAIGDSAGDLAVLSYVNHALCPANAADEVQDICEITAPSSTTSGVIELLDSILAKHKMGI